MQTITSNQSVVKLQKAIEKNNGHFYVSKKDSNKVCIRHPFKTWCIWYEVDTNGNLKYLYTFSQVSKNRLKKRF